MLLIALLVCSFVAQTLYLNVAVLVPLFVHTTFPEMNSFKVGALMAIFPIAYLFAAPLVGSTLTKHGRKSAVIGGVIMMTISTIIFALAGDLTNPDRFYWVSFLARLVQGVADAVVGVVIQAIIVLEFPENQAKYLGYLGMTVGGGICFGPLMASVVARWFSYVTTFYFFAAYIFVFGIGSMLFVPSRVNTV